ncbi:MAG TPA: hypothetical protein K8V90_01600 [Romboutsia timonensis]|uniref:Uncharacterized protein n=1 Tax=Romboutsia timonensis TaxID=1776391 RepID=A0A921MZX1_9FIRM|nr:hypothetical protein [uncultured Romboutsia sp.]HJG95779.1 hypothetical protein [Romboutsia timonensis]
MKENKHNIISALVFSILTIIGYIVTYSNKILFLLVFICERMYSFGAKEDLDNSLDNFRLEDGKQGKKTLGLIIFLILGIICIYLYCIFKYPYILIILILGEILDYSIYKAYKKYKIKKD